MVKESDKRASRSVLRKPEFDTPEFYIYKLEEALEVSLGRPLAFDDLIGRLFAIWSDPDRQFILERLEAIAKPVDTTVTSSWFTYLRRQLSDSQQEALSAALSKLLAEADSLPPRDRAKADRVIARLSRLLNSELAWNTISAWFNDERQFRKSVVIRVLFEYGVPASHEIAVIEMYRKNPSEYRLLKVISRNPNVAKLLTKNDLIAALAIPAQDRIIGEFVLRDTDTRYWRMRAIEAYLVGGHVLSEDVAMQHPMPFAWAVGRLSHRQSLPLLRRVLSRYKSDPEFVWRCLLAMDRVGDLSDVDFVRSLALALITADQPETSLS